MIGLIWAFTRLIRALGQYYLTDRPTTSQPHSAIAPRDTAECFETSYVEHCLRSLALQKQWLSRSLAERMYRYVYILVG